MGRDEKPAKSGKTRLRFHVRRAHFDGPVRRHVDLRPRDEPRIVATGRVEGRFITVVYTRRNGRIASFPPDLPGQMRGSDAE